MKRHLLACLAVMLTGIAAATGAPAPASWSGDLRTLDDIAQREYDALDVERIAAEDAFNEAGGQPPRFAIPHPVAISARTGGTWEQVGDLSVWRLRVSAETAASFNFGFTRYRLPEGAALYVYSTDRAHIAGPYTANDNEEHGQLWTPIIASDDVVIELNVPTAVRDQVELELGSINQGYRGFGTRLDGYEQVALGANAGSKTCAKLGDDEVIQSGLCNTDTTCLSAGDPWNNPRQSAGGVSSGGSLFCSGSLVNNTANNRRMLFMTATHCGVTAASAPSTVIYWNYEWPTCRRPGSAVSGNVNPPNPAITNSGAIFLAATNNPFAGGGAGNTRSDITLIELDDPANPAFNLYWAGWDRRNTNVVCDPPAVPTTTTGLCASIHHPSGDEKRITFVEVDMLIGNIASATGVHWHPFWDPTPPNLPNFPAGGALPPSVTEPGSSGSPLYTASQRFIGVLSGGPSACGSTGANLSDFYGALFHAWDGLGTPATRVRDYLDPGGTNPQFIDGTNGDTIFRNGFEL